MLFNIQALRAIAALLVVHAHAAGLTGLKLDWIGGANGVDLFFVISGFIIAYVASIDTDQFMARRLIRITPIYWSSTLVIYLLVLAMPAAFRSTSADPVLLVRSLAFLPTASSVHRDGIPHPTLSGGWTLNYEMYFYVIFAIALWCVPRRATLAAVAILLGVLAVVQLTGLNTSPIAHFYGAPIVIEFAFGIAAFHVVQVGVRHPPAAAWRSGHRLLLLVIVALGLACLAFAEALFGDAPRWIVSGIPGFFIVVAAVLLERVHATKISHPLAVMVGDASYVLYLIQAYVVFGVTRLVIRDHVFSELPGQLVVLALMTLSVLASVLIYRYYERPLLHYLKRRFIRSRPRRVDPVAVAPS